MTSESGKKAKKSGRPTSSRPSTRKSTTTRSNPRGKSKTDAILTRVPDSANQSSGQTKQSQLIALMQRPEGASLPELIQATHWQPHSVRGVISGILRKKLGLNIACTPSEESGGSRYRILETKSAT